MSSTGPSQTSRLPCVRTKETLVVRLLAQREVRFKFKLARFTDNPDALASSYRRESLRDMCCSGRFESQKHPYIFSRAHGVVLRFIEKC